MYAIVYQKVRQTRTLENEYLHEQLNQNQNNALAGNRTRIDCLEGNHASLYTTDACDKQ